MDHPDPDSGGGSAEDMASEAPRRRSLIGRAVGAVAPAVVRQIDANELVEAIDVNVIAADLDLDALIDRLDLNAIAERLDLDALVDRLDVNVVAERLDLDALVDRLDVNVVAERLDLDALVDRLDVNLVAERLDMARITAGATQEVAVSGLDLVRRQLMRADATVDSLVGRILRREPGSRPDAPGRLVAETPLPTTEPLDGHDLRRRDVSGHYAGAVTRSLGLVGDVFAAIGLQAALGWAAFFVLGLVLGVEMPSGPTRWLGVVLVGAMFVLYFWLPVAFFGRTPAMAMLGVAVVRRDGGTANGRRALVRALVLPLSVVVPVFLLGMVLGRERRTLYDVASGTVEVYDWGERDAEQPVTIRQQLSARVRRRRDLRSDPAVEEASAIGGVS